MKFIGCSRMSACLSLMTLTAGLTVAAVTGRHLTFEASGQVIAGENITASLRFQGEERGRGLNGTCGINCKGSRCSDIIHCPESSPCITFHMEDGSDKTATLETFDVGHITLFVNCSIGSQELFAEVSIGKSTAINLVSVIVGWIYFAAWSASFYPQIITNFTRKSVIGLNFDFLALNLMGFSFYSIFNICLYFIPSFQEAYKAKNPFSSIPVELNDVVFALHAVIVTIVTVIQCLLYDRGNQKLARWSILFLCSATFVAFILLILVLTDSFSKLNYIYYFSYVKLTITIIKYIPQAWFNYSRKSTIGWSIGNILLDMTGGLLSILQMILLSANFNDWGSIFGNPTKFGLGFFSILFDALFITQHYFLYRHVSEEGSQILTP